jgi:hypothetical protein
MLFLVSEDGNVVSRHCPYYQRQTIATFIAAFICPAYILGQKTHPGQYIFGVSISSGFD